MNFIASFIVFHSVDMDALVVDAMNSNATFFRSIDELSFLSIVEV